METKKTTRWAVLNIPPSWILAGEITEETDTHYVLGEAIFVQGVAAGESAWAVAAGRAGTTYPLPVGVRIRRDAVLIEAPSTREALQPLCRAHAAATIRKAK